jgi:hypothetical protein
MGVVLVFRDITGGRRAATARRQPTSMDAFLAVLGHELRLLAGISGAQFLESVGTEDAETKNARHILRQTRHWDA